MLILLVAIIFFHYLIRLCMVAWGRGRHDGSRDLVARSSPGEIARPSEPIQVILARDLELGLHGSDTVEEDKEVAVPPPPPAYGLWRCSVVSFPPVNKSCL